MCAKKCFSGYSETDLTPSESFCIDACADLYIKSQEICSKAYGDYTQETLKLLPKK